MKFARRISVLMLTALIGVSCASGHSPKGKEQTVTVSLQKGKVIPGVSCLKSPSLTYALYLPSSYSEVKKFPVILAFDPHGAGSLPVEQYHELAEKFGYILLGSDNSKNGIGMDEIRNICSGLFQEIHTRFSIDTARIYTMGFSGGARIACLMAQYGGGIAGVIGCGAGFPGNEQTGIVNFSYIGFAGRYDFNMYELVRLDAQLDKQKCDHALFLFDGIHEWPSRILMEKAFVWTELCSMRSGTSRKDAALISQAAQAFTDSIARKKKGTDKLDYHRELKNAIAFLTGLTNTGSWMTLLSGLDNDPAYKKLVRTEVDLMDKELTEQQTLAGEFFLRDTGWWKDKIHEFDKRIANKKDPADARMCRRIKSYLSLAAYTYMSRSQDSGDTAKADFAYQVYQIVDPENAAKIVR
jgi:hypothetical protein